ncbi:MAG: hypothetical protein ACRCWQ_02090 [Bacilli bacterium]
MSEITIRNSPDVRKGMPSCDLTRIRIEIFANGKSVFDREVMKSKFVHDALDEYEEKLMKLYSLKFKIAVIIHCIWTVGHQVFETSEYQGARDIIPTLSLMGTKLP